MPLAADAQRERTVALLRRAYLEGRLESREFDARAETALRARTTGELRAVVRDLPRLGDLVVTARAAAARAAYLAALALVWLVASLVLLVAFVAALVAPGWSAAESLAFPLTWALVTGGLWYAGRRR